MRIRPDEQFLTDEDPAGAYKKRMKITQVSAILLALAVAPVSALADPGKNENGHGKHRHGSHSYKHEYWDGNCKVEIKQKRGEYKEERKCHASPHVHAPVYTPVYQVLSPSVTIQATIPIK